MKKRYQLPEHVEVIDTIRGIVELETTDLTNELQDRFEVMAGRLAEELDLPWSLVAERLEKTVEELTILTLFKGTRDVTGDLDRDQAAISTKLAEDPNFWPKA